MNSDRELFDNASAGQIKQELDRLGAQPVDVIKKAMITLIDHEDSVGYCEDDEFSMWYNATVIPGFGSRTPAEAVAEGQIDAVVAHFQRNYYGGYA